MLVNLSLCIDFRAICTQGHAHVIELADGLSNLTELQELSLVLRWEMQANNIDEAAIVLADRLKHLHKIHTLRIDLQHDGSFNKIMTLFPSLIHLQNI